MPSYEAAMPFSIRPYRRFFFQCFMTIPDRGIRMTRLLLIALLVLSNGPAYAEWVAIGSADDGMTAYVDPDTIRGKEEKEEMVKMWVLFDFKTTQTVAGHLMLSIKGQEEYDCDGKRRRVLTFSEFSGNMGGGKEVKRTSDVGTWVPVDPKSVVQTLWTFACGKK
jgi:hypothetical protein